MCGICGVIGFPGVAPETPFVVRRMAQLIAHRGPDGEGFHDMAHGSLGHRRLAIIDVDGGAQPMASSDGRVVVVFNGEIYNFAGLRHELASRGHVFRTRSDTEVLVHGYEEWGDDVVDRLRGMFAFALWDRDEERLLVARDRLGIKPFYYWHDVPGGRLVFGSEIKALFADPAVPRRPNEERLGEYLLFRYVAGEETMFAGVRELEPGTTAVFDRRGLTTRRYWEPEPPSRSIGFAAAVAEGRERMQDAVHSHLVSDVGIGTITSGGLDSSLVSALAARGLGSTLDTFCLGFDDPALDERPYAREVAGAIGSVHHDTVLGVDAFAEQLDALTWAHDEPISHPNAIAMHRVFAMARHDAGIPVLLSGEGADEVFGGYGWYRAAWKLHRIRSVLGNTLASGALRLVLRGQARDVADPDYLLLANALGRAPELLGVPQVREAVARRRDAYAALCADPAGLFRYDQLTYLQPLLQRQDRMSMAVGLEARVPFLDHPLVDWANALAVEVKLGAGRPKRLLRAISEGSLPHGIIHRQKVGFALPLGDWLRGPLRERLHGVARGDTLAAEVLGRPLLRRAVERLDRGGNDSVTLLWSVLALDAWSEVFSGAASPVLHRPIASV
jgi:asparagine synthase (glutamine-hydrolysing)